MNNDFDINKETEVVLEKFLREKNILYPGAVDIPSLKEGLLEQGIALRCEWFFKNIEKDGEDTVFDAVAIPWIEKVGQPRTRAEVYHAMKLIDKGYIL